MEILRDVMEAQQRLAIDPNDSAAKRDVDKAWALFLMGEVMGRHEGKLRDVRLVLTPLGCRSYHFTVRGVDNAGRLLDDEGKIRVEVAPGGWDGYFIVHVSGKDRDGRLFSSTGLYAPLGRRLPDEWMLTQHGPDGEKVTHFSRRRAEDGRTFWKTGAAS